MTYTLYIGDQAYSSWSLRGYLVLAAFGLPFTVRHAHFNTPEFETLRAEIAPARQVPTIKTPEGQILWDSLAIAETLAERHPDAGLWPRDPDARAMARVLCAEMHASFADLRRDCPMNLRRRYLNFAPSDAVRADVARLTDLWARARAMGGDGPFLFGGYSAADAFFAPAASRLATYGLIEDAATHAYVAALHAEPHFAAWRRAALVDTFIQDHYEFDLDQAEVFDPASPFDG